ncbi:ABC transporter ATP-binding protein [Catellatospora coxensis]|uniref:ABC transporter ATP-binding protein n=1 Tax=Catellatospora coxensis TaxID=310354 RepID=A0A8J3LAY3_9ACTN|nr:ABC transporter ATP-binding protein [Catellatospora coxensis]GIG09405.1 ABC transporter ATP-binding protein [Catellatospora coxensis]
MNTHTETTRQASRPDTPGPAHQDGLIMRDVTMLLGDGEDTVRALDSVHLTVAAGEFAAIVGPSGSGKSSLLAVAGGLAAPDSGTVTIAGRPMTAASRRARTALRRDLVGFVFQSGNLLPALTAIDQLRLPTRFASPGAVGRDPMDLLTEVGMAGKADRRPHQLSGGERQRVGIARALVTGPRLLLVDEPTAALDQARSRDIVQMLARETRQHAVATVMVTHDTEVLQYCDSVYEMMDGALSKK